MKFALLTSIALFAAPAMAADMANKAANPLNSYAAVPMFAGFYVGGQAGGAWNTFDTNRDTLENVKPSGFVYGGHAGYNWQPGPVVVGLELAFTEYGTKKNTDLNLCSGKDCVAVGNDVLKIRYVADALAKGGFTPMPNVLVYGTGGVSWAAISFGETGTNAFGWAAGGGIDWLPFGNHIVLGAKYLYRGLGKPTLTGNDLTGHELTGRISYKF